MSEVRGWDLKPLKAHAFYCGQCDLEFYLNVAAAAAGLIRDEHGRLLATVRAGDPKKGTLDLPGGFIDPGEGAEESLVREIREELNLNVTGLDYFCSMPNRYLYKGVLYATHDIVFNCSVEDLSVLKVMDDISDIRWFSKMEIPLDEFGFESVQKILKLFINSDL